MFWKLFDNPQFAIDSHSFYFYSSEKIVSDESKQIIKVNWYINISGLLRNGPYYDIIMEIKSYRIKYRMSLSEEIKRIMLYCSNCY